MKFSSSLKFNAVSEWWDDYIAYATLKKYIYQLEKQQHGHDPILAAPYRDHDLEANESSSLMGSGGQVSGTDAIFVPLLDRELKKIVNFYEHQEKELLDELSELEESIKLQEEAGLAGDRYIDDVGGVSGDEDDDDEDDDESLSRSRDRDPSAQRRRKSSTTSRMRRSLSLQGGASSTIPELSPVGHRYSISSSSDGNDLDNSLVSLKNATVTKSNPIGRFAHKLRDSIVSTGSHGNPNDNATGTIWTARSDYAYDTRLLFKRRITTLYISVSSLKAYVEVNYSGFRKILKKYDKVTYSELKDRYLHTTVEPALPFTAASKSHLTVALTRLLDLYTKCVTRGDARTAKQQLRLHQRENIAWERDTVWRQMIGRERRGEGEDGSGSQPKAVLLLNAEGNVVGGGEGSDGEGGKDIPTPVGRFRLTRRKIYRAVAGLVLVGLLNVEVVKGGGEANRCFAVLVFCTILWATEAIPLFVTSMFVPLLLVLLKVIRGEDGTQLSRPAATKYVFSTMFSPTIMLLIGGFTISSALSKMNIDRILITRVLSFAGTRPSTVLLAFMGVSCFASMWISNVAAPTLCFTLIRPILRTLPPKSAFGPCLILAIALAANIGGQSSPISSPQNLIALQAMEPPIGWLSWFAVALPVSAISIILIWLLLLVSYRPARSPDGEGDIEIKAIRSTKEAFTFRQYWVSFVCLVTIGLWCVEHEIEEYVGDMGVIAIIPIVAFFSTGVLKKDDFEQFAWTIVFLAMGGIALGKGVMSSGLLEVMDLLIRDMVSGFSLYTVVLILSPVVLVISTFISHTIASVLLVPIAKEVGSSLPGDHKNLLIFITGLICSAGMGMPVSGFPNQTAATQEDELGELYLSNVDFLKNGVPASIIATIVVATVGYVLMRVIGM